MTFLKSTNVLFKQSTRTKIFLIFIALCLTSVQYHRVRHIVLAGPHPEYKVNYYLSFINGLESFKKNVPYFHRARIVSCFQSAMVCKAFGLRHHNKQPVSYANVIAFDYCIWLFLTFLAIILLSHYPLLVLLGTGAALQYSFLPMSEGQVAPWDMPSLFWWFLVLLLNETKYKHCIVYLIPIGAMYKEILVVLSILILFWKDYSVKRRVVTFFIVSGIGVAFKMISGCIGGCDILGNQSFRYDYNPIVQKHICRTGETWIWQRNLHSLFWWSNFNPIYFSISGLWLGLIFLPIPAKFRVIALVYCSTVFIPGNITEGRLWHELIPVFFVGYEGMKKRIQKKRMDDHIIKRLTEVENKIWLKGVCQSQ